MNNNNFYESVRPYEQDFGIGLNSFEKLTTMRPHWHEHIEFVYITRGDGVFILNGKRYPVSPGDLIIANPNTLHALLSDSGIDYHCMLIRPDFFSKDDINTMSFKSLIKSDKTIESIFAELKSEYVFELAAADIMKKAIVYRLIAYLARNYSKPTLSKEDIERRTAALSRIRKVEDFVSKNYKNKISTSDLAKIFYVSENHFCRLFKKTVGISAIEYINEDRIGKSELLLSQTDLSITEIAAEVGFENANYFARVFNKIRKESPSEYRKRIAE